MKQNRGKAWPLPTKHRLASCAVSWTSSSGCGSSTGRARDASGSLLLDVWDPHDAALRLRVVRVLHAGNVKVLPAGAERHVGGAVARGDRKHVQQPAVGSDLQDLPAEPLGDVHVARAID